MTGGYGYVTGSLGTATNTGTFKIKCKLHTPSPNGPNYTWVTIDLGNVIQGTTGAQKAEHLAGAINTDTTHGLSASTLGNLLTVAPTDTQSGNSGIRKLDVTDKTGQSDSLNMKKAPSTSGASLSPQTQGSAVDGARLMLRQELGCFRVTGAGASGIHNSVSGSASVAELGDEYSRVSLTLEPGMTPAEIAEGLCYRLSTAGVQNVVLGDVVVIFLEEGSNDGLLWWVPDTDLGIQMTILGG